MTVHDEKKHGLVDGDFVKFAEVKGMTQLNSQLGGEPKVFQIKEIGPFSFSIGDTSSFSEYQGGGIATQVKVQTEIDFVCFFYDALLT